MSVHFFVKHTARHDGSEIYEGICKGDESQSSQNSMVGAIGAFLIFCSWFVQNKYSSELAEARRNLDGSITNIGLAASTAEDWTARYFDLKAKPNPDRKLLLAAAFKALQWNLVATKLAADRATHDDWALALLSSDDTLFHQTSDALLKRFEQGNLEALEADLATFIKITRHVFGRSSIQRLPSDLFMCRNGRVFLISWLSSCMWLVSGFAIWDFFVREPPTQ